MVIDFNGKQYTLKYSFRALMIYENITQKSFNPKGISDVMIFFYAVLVASAKDTTLDFDKFLGWMSTLQLLMSFRSGLQLYLTIKPE